MSIAPKAGVFVASGSAWLCSLLAAGHHSLAAIPGTPPDGVSQLGEHLPLFIVIGGGVGALWVGVGKVIGLYSAGILKVQEIVREELQKHTASEQTALADLVRRVAHVERMVDARGRPAPPPFSVPRSEE